MLIKNFINHVDNLKASVALYKFICVVTTAGMVLTSYISYSAVKNVRTIILPPIVDSRIEITGTDVDDNYLKLFTKYSLGLLFNYTPENFPDQGADLVKLATPQYRDSLKLKVEEMAVSIEEMQITSMFYPYKFEINRSKNQIKTLGTRKQSANGMAIEDGRKNYIIQYVINNGRFEINGIQEASDQ